MKISNTTSSYIKQTYASQANTETANQNLKVQQQANEKAAAADSLVLSDRTRDLQKISKAMDSQPAEREKFVADLKQQVESGQYNRNMEMVAEKMMNFSIIG